MKTVIIFLLLVVVILAVVFFIISSPKFEPEFFKYSYITKYGSPVDLYETYVSFLRSKDQKLFEEMIGRKLKEKEKLPDLAYMELPPSIHVYKIEGDHATIITSEGQKIEMDFVKGRWVLSQKTPAFYLRGLFRKIKHFVINFSRKFKGEKTEKIEAPSKR